MKERSLPGLCKKTEVITINEEDQMWTSNNLGESTGKQLVKTLVHLFCLHFALRAWWKRIPPSSMCESISCFQN